MVKSHCLAGMIPTFHTTIDIFILTRVYCGLILYIFLVCEKACIMSLVVLSLSTSLRTNALNLMLMLLSVYLWVMVLTRKGISVIILPHKNSLLPWM